MRIQTPQVTNQTAATKSVVPKKGMLNSKEALEGIGKEAMASELAGVFNVKQNSATHTQEKAQHLTKNNLKADLLDANRGKSVE